MLDFCSQTLLQALKDKLCHCTYLFFSMYACYTCFYWYLVCIAYTLRKAMFYGTYTYVLRHYCVQIQRTHARTHARTHIDPKMFTVSATVGLTFILLCSQRHNIYWLVMTSNLSNCIVLHISSLSNMSR